MFGYIKIDKPELKIKEYETYRGVYCSLCKALGKRVGFAARFTLNYDFTFLALLRLAVQKECPSFEKARCSFNPLVRCSQCTGGEKALDFTCAAAGSMLYYKALDTVRDDRGAKRTAARLFLPVLRRYSSYCQADYPELEPMFLTMARQQEEAEREKTASLDKAAHPTAQMLGGLFSYGEADEVQRRVLERLGYCLGRYVYFMDAADDRRNDMKSGSYNPFVTAYQLTEETVDGEEPLLRMEQVIGACIQEAQKAYYLLDVARYGGILENILNNGLPNMGRQVLYNKRQAGEV